jgi:hypothetical protein
MRHFLGARVQNASFSAALIGGIPNDCGSMLDSFIACIAVEAAAGWQAALLPR